MKTPTSRTKDQGKGIVLFEDGATILHLHVVLRLLQFPSGISVLERPLSRMTA